MQNGHERDACPPSWAPKPRLPDRHGRRPLSLVALHQYHRLRAYFRRWVKHRLHHLSPRATALNLNWMMMEVLLLLHCQVTMIWRAFTTCRRTCFNICLCTCPHSLCIICKGTCECLLAILYSYLSRWCMLLKLYCWLNRLLKTIQLILEISFFFKKVHIWVVFFC